MTEHGVVIAGGGPAGMMLAAELALAKVDVAVVERRPDHVLVGSRAGGFHSRTIEVLDQRGVADRFLAEGQVAQAATFGTTVLDMSDFPTRHPYSLGIWQNQIERIMAAWIAELPVRIYYGCTRGDSIHRRVGEDPVGGISRLGVANPSLTATLREARLLSSAASPSKEASAT
jgi:2-polyprenyl-6-methoxyphenol hydroxylase-like FAD-dependent oxidoreductase